MSKTAPKKHSVRIAGHPTSISLEPEFWQALCEIAARRSVPVNALLAEIDEGRRGNLSSAIRLFVLDSCRRGELHSSIFAGETSGNPIVGTSGRAFMPYRPLHTRATLPKAG